MLNKSFGVASYNRKLAKKHKKIDNPVKMKPIVDFTTETSKETEWDNIACVHRDTLVATTWSFKQQKMGELKLRHPRFKVCFLTFVKEKAYSDKILILIISYVQRSKKFLIATSTQFHCATFLFVFF